jgi:hypothetical protein
LIRLARKAVLVLMTLCFVAMVTGVSVRLHWLSRDHLEEHDFDHCSICQQLLSASGKFIPGPQLSLLDVDLHRDNGELLPQLYVTTFHYNLCNPRPPPLL